MNLLERLNAINIPWHKLCEGMFCIPWPDGQKLFFNENSEFDHLIRMYADARIRSELEYSKTMRKYFGRL